MTQRSPPSLHSVFICFSFCPLSAGYSRAARRIDGGEKKKKGTVREEEIIGVMIRLSEKESCVSWGQHSWQLEKRGRCKERPARKMREEDGVCSFLLFSLFSSLSFPLTFTFPDLYSCHSPPNSTHLIFLFFFLPLFPTSSFLSSLSFSNEWF